MAWCGRHARPAPVAAAEEGRQPARGVRISNGTRGHSGLDAPLRVRAWQRAYAQRRAAKRGGPEPLGGGEHRHKGGCHASVRWRRFNKPCAGCGSGGAERA